MALVRWLEQQQKQERLSDVAFAAKLGISQSFWNLLHRGLRPARSYILICGALRNYPDDWMTIVRAVAEDCGASEAAA